MPIYDLRTECGDNERFEAADDAAAHAQAIKLMEEAEFDLSEGTVWFEGYLFRIDEDGLEAPEMVDTLEVAFDPPAPDCAGGDEHDWQAPHSLLGGNRENPGVSGHGGGVIIREVCAQCGVYRVMDTWAQNPENGEQGLASMAYEEADDAALAWVRSLNETEDEAEIRTAKELLDAWDPDEADEAEVARLFEAVYERRPDADDENLVSHIYAAVIVLDVAEARRVIKVLGGEA